MILIFIFILPLLIYIDVYQVKVLYLLHALLLVCTSNIFMDFSLNHYWSCSDLDHMRIRRKRKLFDILQFSFCGVNFYQSHFVRYGILALKNEILPVYNKQGIQNVSGTGSREGTLSCFVQTLIAFFV